MEISYDKDADVLYIKLKNGKFKTNKKVSENVILDLDDKNNVLGVEFLFVSENIPLSSLNNIKLKNLIPNK